MGDFEVGPRGGHFRVSARTGNKYWIGGGTKIAKAPAPKAMKSWASDRPKATPPPLPATARAAPPGAFAHANPNAIHDAKTGAQVQKDRFGAMGTNAGKAVREARQNLATGLGSVGHALGRAVGKVRYVAKHPEEALAALKGKLGAWAQGRKDAIQHAAGKAAGSVGAAMGLKSPIEGATASIEKYQTSGPTKHPRGTRADVDGFRKASGRRGLPKSVVGHIAQGRPVRYKGKTYDTPSMKARRAAAPKPKLARTDARADSRRGVRARGGAVAPPKGKEWMASAKTMTPAQLRWAKSLAAKQKAKQAPRRRA